MRIKVKFKSLSSPGQSLAGVIETPAETPKAYVLFAHCFTCGKDVAAASRISRALTASGFAVLRFDFTGLGNSDGDFANSNFSSNVEDLVAASEFLGREYEAPKLLIGHSLGGLAILTAAPKIPSAMGVVSIAAPAHAAHVIKNFEADVSQIEEKGQAEVDLAGRKFTIKKQFLDDVRGTNQRESLAKHQAVLLMHSPLDTTVSIEQAELLYNSFKHPKSFVSLDTADHLLSDKQDSEYVSEVISGWAKRYIPTEQDAMKSKVEKGELFVSEKDHKFTVTVNSDSHHWLADEPISVGGSNLGPDPYEHLLAALGTCTVMTLRMYANHKSLPLDHIQVRLLHQKDYHKDCINCDSADSYAELIEREIELVGELSEQQRERLLEIADKCPVHKTLHSELKVLSKLVDIE